MRPGCPRLRCGGGAAVQPDGCSGVRVRNVTGTPGVQNNTVIVPSFAVSDTVTVSPDFTAAIIARRTEAAD
jgi:hypothetical protein